MDEVRSEARTSRSVQWRPLRSPDRTPLLIRNWNGGRFTLLGGYLERS